MSLEGGDITGYTIFAETKAVTLGLDGAVPESFRWKAIKPAYKHERTTPENGDSHEAKTNTSHDASLD